MEKNLQILQQTAYLLEKSEREYDLSELVNKSGLNRDIVKSLLKEYWINSDYLNILHLDLNLEEEYYLYELA